MHWHSHWERVFGKARGRKRYIQLSRLSGRKKIVKSQFVKLAMKSIQQRNFVKEQAEKNQKTNRNGRRKDGARRVPHHHCPPLLNKQTNKKGRRLKLENKYLKKRVSKFFNKATAPVNRYVKFQKLSSFKTVETRNSIDIFHHEFWFELRPFRYLNSNIVDIGHCSSYNVVL